MFKLAESGRRAILTLDRPPANAINDDWLAQFHGLLDRLEQRHELTVLHVRSANKIFSAGMDLVHVGALSDRPDGGARMERDVSEIQRAFARLESSSMITIAEIGGAALGGGLELTLACDLRIASRTAKLGLPECRLGLIPGAGGTQRLTRLCGRGIAARIIIGADVVDGATAERLGLVQWSFEHDRLAEEAERIARQVSELAPQAIQEAKRLIALWGDRSGDGYREEVRAARRLFETAESRTRVAHFLAGDR